MSQPIPSRQTTPTPLPEVMLRGGGRSAVARKLSIKASAVSQWRGQVPTHHVRAVAQLTGIPAADLRPELWGEEALNEILNAHLEHTSEALRIEHPNRSDFESS